MIKSTVSENTILNRKLLKILKKFYYVYLYHDKHCIKMVRQEVMTYKSYYFSMKHLMATITEDVFIIGISMNDEHILAIIRNTLRFQTRINCMFISLECREIKSYRKDPAIRSYFSA